MISKFFKNISSNTYVILSKIRFKLSQSPIFHLIVIEMQQSKRNEVAKYLSDRNKSIKCIANQCQVSLKSVYNVRTKLQKGENLVHKKGAGRKWKLDKPSHISLGMKLKNQPRVSLRTLKSQFKLEKGINVSHEAIRRTAKKIGYSKKTSIRGPAITEANEIKRVAWAYKHINI